MAKQDSTMRTLVIILGLCLVCSLLVCIAVVCLRPLQEKAINVDREKSILAAAQVEIKDNDISATYKGVIEARLLDMATGDFLPNDEAQKIANGNIDGFDFVKAAKSEDKSQVIPADKDKAKIRVRSKYMPVYLVKSASGEITKVILPFYGQGLWSTMYGYLSLTTDGQLIQGVKYYSHGETPGLGAEIENPMFTAKWVGKKLFGEDGSVKFAVLKNVTEKDYQVDALSGATLTSNGVSASVQYWVDDNGYGPFLKKLKTQGVK